MLLSTLYNNKDIKLEKNPFIEKSCYIMQVSMVLSFECLLLKVRLECLVAIEKREKFMENRI
jgi:hypothetical protein